MQTLLEPKVVTRKGKPVSVILPSVNYEEWLPQFLPVNRFRRCRKVDR